ncbi:hypothetical protein BSKO_01933 [Bryopsis sp. KO-2023]|nr:hypothetical protein BSKO_01933 [Bryopsis sp. KO-2023]
MPATRNTTMGSQVKGLGLSDKRLERKYPEEPGLDDWEKDAAEQDEAVEELRQALVNRGSWNPRLDFYTLLRFLRARDYDVERSLAMMMDHLQWRQENRVDHILHEFEFTEREEFLSVYPQGYHQTDKQGNPIYIQHIGCVDLARIREVTTEDRMTKYHIQEYERCLEHIFPIVSRVHGRQIDKTFAIVDAKGLGLRHLTRDVRASLGTIMAIDQNNYPETLYHTCIINAPAAFRAIWGMVKPMLNARTQAKVEVCPKDYLPALKKWIDEENIPEYLGGKSKGTLVDDVGPWQDEELIRELELENEKRKAKPRKNSLLDSGELVQRQWSSLSSGTDYQDAVSAPPSLTDSFPKSVEAKEMDAEPLKSNDDDIGVPTNKNTQSLATRIHDLETRLPQQMQRLQPYVAARGAGTHLTPPTPNTLLARVEVLEQGMDILLRAQETAWAKEKFEEPADRKCCNCCCIM